MLASQATQLVGPSAATLRSGPNRPPASASMSYRSAPAPGSRPAAGASSRCGSPPEQSNNQTPAPIRSAPCRSCSTERSVQPKSRTSDHHQDRDQRRIAIVNDSGARSGCITTSATWTATITLTRFPPTRRDRGPRAGRRCRPGARARSRSRPPAPGELVQCRRARGRRSPLAPTADHPALAVHDLDRSCASLTGPGRDPAARRPSPRPAATAGPRCPGYKVTAYASVAYSTNAAPVSPTAFGDDPEVVSRPARLGPCARFLHDRTLTPPADSRPRGRRRRSLPTLRRRYPTYTSTASAATSAALSQTSSSSSALLITRSGFARRVLSRTNSRWVSAAVPRHRTSRRARSRAIFTDRERAGRPPHRGEPHRIRASRTTSLNGSSGGDRRLVERVSLVVLAVLADGA